ncbi:hypothetical protein [uncultured Bacteroides sp.]|uniref:carboxylate--amine ligase n=1 Tax=uncultured Bacteroides sp. TaxID=162156 RepID=UPI002AA81F90|nr:hypothetical protein [uncultured Bacteroides sp.]
MKISGAIIIEGHVQGLSNVRSLGERGIPIYVIDVNHCLAQHSKYCRKFFRCPAFSSPQFIDFILKIGENEQLDGWVLIPSNDHIVENLSHNKERLTPYFKTIVPSPDILNKIINKKNLLDVALQCGTPFPATCYPENLKMVKSFNFPILLKGNYGLSFYKATHAKAIQANNIEELHSLLSDILTKVEPKNIMIQELIPFDAENKVVSFTCFAEQGEIKTYWMGEKLREHPIKYGTATYSRSINIPQVLRGAVPLVNNLSYTGVCEIEFMRDPRDGVYKLIEINPRTWLWVGLAKTCGIDYAYMVYAYLNKLPINYGMEYTINIKWINWITDLVFGMESIVKHNITLRNYLKSLKGRKVNAIWNWNDIMPGIAFLFLLLYIAKKRG